MRKPVSSHEVPHLWAHKAQESAYTRTRNFYFEGDTIYSYGSHFPIARHVTHKGKAGILFTCDTHSVTTTGHVSAVWQAIHNHPATVIYLPTLRGLCGRFSILDRTSLVKQGLTNLHVQIVKATTECYGPSGRFRPKKWSALDTLIDQANAFAKFFGSKRRWELPETPEAVGVAIAKDRAKQDRADELTRKRRFAAEAARNLKLAENLTAWRAGEAISYYDLPRKPVALRIGHRIGEEDVVETSLGANVPIEHARRGLAFVRRCRDNATPYQRNGHTLHLGHYAIDSIDADGTLHAGCHTISFEEIERIAPML